MTTPLNSVFNSSFSPKSTAPPTEIRPSLWRILERALHVRHTFDPTGMSSTSDIGRLIFECAKVASPDSPLLPSALANYTSLLFTSIYSTLAGQVLFQKAEAPRPLRASNRVGPQSRPRMGHLHRCRGAKHLHGDQSRSSVQTSTHHGRQIARPVFPIERPPRRVADTSICRHH
jgi:hypothetical protein